MKYCWVYNTILSPYKGCFHCFNKQYTWWVLRKLPAQSSGAAQKRNQFTFPYQTPEENCKYLFYTQSWKKPQNKQAAKLVAKRFKIDACVALGIPGSQPVFLHKEWRRNRLRVGKSQNQHVKQKLSSSSEMNPQHSLQQFYSQGPGGGGTGL